MPESAESCCLLPLDVARGLDWMIANDVVMIVGPATVLAYSWKTDKLEISREGETIAYNSKGEIVRPPLPEDV